MNWGYLKLQGFHLVSQSLPIFTSNLWQSLANYQVDYEPDQHPLISISSLFWFSLWQPLRTLLLQVVSFSAVFVIDLGNFRIVDLEYCDTESDMIKREVSDPSKSRTFTVLFCNLILRQM